MRSFYQAPHRLLPAISASLVMLALLLAPAAHAQVLYQSDNPMLEAPDDHHVVFYPAEEPLLDSRLLTLKGRILQDGGCEFTLPVLSLEADQVAVRARQLSTDYTECTSVVEFGIPLDADAEPYDEADAMRERLQARPEDGVLSAPQTDLRSQAAPAVKSASAYYRVWWEDVINLRVHEAKSNISWSYDGSCVTSASGSLSTYWLSATGWGKVSSGSTITTGCSSRKVYSDAHFANGAFCWPGTVNSYYDDVTVRGTSTNGLSGWYGSTWTTYPFACPTLHFHTELKRITG